MGNQLWCQAHLSQKAWSLAEKLSELEAWDENPNRFGGAERYWTWLKRKVELAEEAARRDPREARKYASWNLAQLSANPGFTIVKVKINSRRSRRKRVPADTACSVGLELSARICLDAAEAEEARRGIDAFGQAILLRGNE